MKRDYTSSMIRTIAGFIWLVCGIFLIAASAQTDALAAPRDVRAVTQNTTPGQTITVVLEADAAGDESIYGFSLNYSTAILTYVPNSVMIGTGATRQLGGLCNVLENANTAGRIGFSVDCNNSTITAGNNRQFVTMRFTVAANAPLGSTPLTFGDTPARRSVASNPQAGPIMSLPTTFTDGNVNIVSNTGGVTRIVRVRSQNTSQNARVTVVLEADAAGDESIYGFSLNYSTAILTYVPNSVMIGTGATRQLGGLCNVLENANTAGRIGFSVDCNNSTITAGNNRRFITMQFDVASGAPNGQTPLTFGDTPARRSVASNPQAGPIMSLPTSFNDGFLTIAPPTAALVPISGRVMLPNGSGVSKAIVELSNGSRKTIRIYTDNSGYYRLEARAGETSVLAVTHKRYQFTSRVVTANDAVENFDFTAEP